MVVLAYRGAGVVKWGCLGWSEVKVLRGELVGLKRVGEKGQGRDRERGD